MESFNIDLSKFFRPQVYFFTISISLFFLIVSFFYLKFSIRSKERFISRIYLHRYILISTTLLYLFLSLIMMTSTSSGFDSFVVFSLSFIIYFLALIVFLDFNIRRMIAKRMYCRINLKYFPLILIFQFITLYFNLYEGGCFLCWESLSKPNL